MKRGGLVHSPIDNNLEVDHLLGWGRSPAEQPRGTLRPSRFRLLQLPEAVPTNSAQPAGSPTPRTATNQSRTHVTRVSTAARPCPLSINAHSGARTGLPKGVQRKELHGGTRDSNIYVRIGM
jgi:hypothetical protein